MKQIWSLSAWYLIFFLTDILLIFSTSTINSKHRTMTLPKFFYATEMLSNKPPSSVLFFLEQTKCYLVSVFIKTLIGRRRRIYNFVIYTITYIITGSFSVAPYQTSQCRLRVWEPRVPEMIKLFLLLTNYKHISSH